MFVQVCAFGAASGVTLPEHLRNPPTNSSAVTLALVRWLSPHPNAVLRDFHHRPLCPAPFDINHALWRFTKLPNPRVCFTGPHFQRQQHLFENRGTIADISRAQYDFVQLESIESIMNCTKTNSDSIMETITLPFI